MLHTSENQIFEQHEYGIAMLDVDQDGDLDCLTARRTEFDKDAPSATYVWQLKGLNGKEKREITFHFKPGPTPDQAIFTLDDTDGTEHLLKTLYTDYHACALLQLPYAGREEADDDEELWLKWVFATHPSGLALLDADDDGDLDCMKAVRTNYDESGPSAEYVWILKGLNGHPMKNITVHFEKGDTPDKAVVTVDNGCLLWVTEEAKDNIPSKCHEEFLKNCNTESIIYDKETCDQA
ncbi:hypothetical protein HPB51_018963 [Rhipicephalus microplus]|uniref:Uncharacterized protein n=1 Tax=Rhipicephalus microplus TaxID=6941 RepID=A0A9J6D6J9_RHIMP|nr:hypothetical protein HPB51_018963 [Rhipicephalus microplus]